VFVRSRCVVCSGRAGDSPVTHRSCRSCEDLQEHVQVVFASNWCLRMGRVRFGSAGAAHHGFPVCVLRLFFGDVDIKTKLRTNVRDKTKT
jgi:hypothetical protein